MNVPAASMEVRSIAANAPTFSPMGQFAAFARCVEVGAELYVSTIRRALSGPLEGEDQARFELERVEFHRAVRASYLELSKAEPDRFRIVDANRSIDAIHAELLALVEATL